MLGFAGQKLVSIIGVLAGIYLLLVIILLVFQSKFLFFPSKGLDYTPELFGMSYEDVFFKASDSTELHGWFIPAAEPAGTLLFCHGNAGNISHRLQSVKIFHDLDLNVFIFDYRGYGKSGGKISENGTYLDSEAAMNYLINEKQTDPTNIVIFGRSLGGSIASWLAKEHTPCALILESSFTSVADAAGDVYPFLPVKLISRFDYNTQENVRIVKCPILIVHSRQDELIKFKHGQKLFETSGEPKMFLELTGSHNDGFILSGKRYVNGLKTFLNQYLNKE